MEGPVSDKSAPCVGLEVSQHIMAVECNYLELVILLEAKRSEDETKVPQSPKKVHHIMM